jgi:hypothetical protein
LKSFNVFALDFLRSFGSKVKLLKIDGKFSFGGYVKILKDIKNCESLDITHASLEGAGPASERISLEKLQNLTVSLINRDFTRLISVFDCPNLCTLTIHLECTKSLNLLTFLSRLSHIKCLTLSEIDRWPEDDFQPPVFTRQLFEKLHLDELKTDGVNERFVNWFIGMIACPKKIKISTKGFQNNIALSCGNFQNLETLELDDFDGDFWKLAALKHLKTLNFVYKSNSKNKAYPRNSGNIPDAIKNLKHFSFFECTPINFSFLVNVLKNFTQLESFEVSEYLEVSKDITKFFLDADFVRENLKTLKLKLKLPFSSQLYEKLVKMFPNIENLEMKSAWVVEDECWSSKNEGKIEECDENEMKKFDQVMKAFHDKNDAEFFKLLEQMDLLKLNREKLEKAQICIFQLGFKHLKSLKFSFSNFFDGLEDLVRKNEHLQVFEISCYRKLSPTEGKKFTTSNYDRNTNTFKDIKVYSSTLRFTNNIYLELVGNFKIVKEMIQASLFSLSTTENTTRS